MSTRRKIDKIISFLLILVGFVFAIVSFYYSINNPLNFYYPIGFAVGLMFAVTVVDRDVYKDRLTNLFKRIGEVENMEVKIERTKYTDYIVTVEYKDE